jgi:hypothetical protein
VGDGVADGAGDAPEALLEQAQVLGRGLVGRHDGVDLDREVFALRGIDGHQGGGGAVETDEHLRDAVRAVGIGRS